MVSSSICAVLLIWKCHMVKSILEMLTKPKLRFMCNDIWIKNELRLLSIEHRALNTMWAHVGAHSIVILLFCSRLSRSSGWCAWSMYRNKRTVNLCGAMWCVCVCVMYLKLNCISNAVISKSTVIVHYSYCNIWNALSICDMNYQHLLLEFVKTTPNDYPLKSMSYALHWTLNNGTGAPKYVPGIHKSMVIETKANHCKV